MKTKLNVKNVPYHLSHDAPRGYEFVAVALLGLLLGVVSLAFAGLTVNFGTIGAAALILLSFLMWRNSRANRAKWENSCVSNTDLSDLSLLFDEAAKHRVELPPLPKSGPDTMTNGELSAWCVQANPMLLRQERENLVDSLAQREKATPVRT